ncbi:toll/interleukin-1 receptor domain-containing protein, partial [Candidatus Magnetaquicoccus inordinatus]|uniref:toll/interleukin-1 receptor domain-containing protein n=1 Tax=Candidatus Magnetaquicoccus inordinatus TaxID=2496818 RepID=UPI00102C6B69
MSILQNSPFNVRLGTDSWPVPSGIIPFGNPVVVRIGVAPHDDNLVILIKYRRPHGLWMSLPTHLLPENGKTAERYYEGRFGALVHGTSIEYIIQYFLANRFLGQSEPLQFRVEPIAIAAIRNRNPVRALTHSLAKVPRPKSKENQEGDHFGGYLQQKTRQADELATFPGKSVSSPFSKMVFLSYSTKDTKTAEWLKSTISQAAFSVWFDQTDMRSGERILSQIGDAIAHVSHVVVLVTNNSCQSTWVRQEIRLARTFGIDLLLATPSSKQLQGSLPRFLRDQHILNMEETNFKDRLFQHLQEKRVIPKSPMLLPLKPEGFVPRSRELAELKAKLFTEEEQIVAITTTALVGTGGFGKTWLAQAACHDSEVEDFFYDGILWVTLGSELDQQAVLSRLATLIREIAHESCPPDLDAARLRLDELLTDRQILLVLDDAWSKETLQHFLGFGGQTVKRVITTRMR